MVRERFFSHETPDGRWFDVRLQRAGYTRGWSHWTLGENLRWGANAGATPEAAFHAWMRSAEHRVNILDPEFRDTGVGVVLGAPRQTYAHDPSATYTQEFGSRR
jgi:uncharacterized protein YkwD